MIKYTIILCLLLLVLNGNLWAHRTDIHSDFIKSEQNLIALFPAPKKDMLRKVIYLPKKANEEYYHVELLIGIEKRVDCNRYMLGGKLETRNLPERGYSYLYVDNLTDIGTTTIPCIPGDVGIHFITAALGAGAMQPYNSSVPLVIYVPEGVEVRYRIWKMENLSSSAEEL